MSKYIELLETIRADQIKNNKKIVEAETAENDDFLIDLPHSKVDIRTPLHEWEHLIIHVRYILDELEKKKQKRLAENKPVWDSCYIDYLANELETVLKRITTNMTELVSLLDSLCFKELKNGKS